MTVTDTVEREPPKYSRDGWRVKQKFRRVRMSPDGLMHSKRCWDIFEFFFLYKSVKDAAETLQDRRRVYPKIQRWILHRMRKTTPVHSQDCCWFRLDSDRNWWAIRRRSRPTSFQSVRLFSSSVSVVSSASSGSGGLYTATLILAPDEFRTTVSATTSGSWMTRPSRISASFHSAFHSGFRRPQQQRYRMQSSIGSNGTAQHIKIAVMSLQSFNDSGALSVLHLFLQSKFPRRKQKHQPTNQNWLWWIDFQ